MTPALIAESTVAWRTAAGTDFAAHTTKVDRIKGSTQ
eukprot:SAG31_NODE_32982_length_349_cov_1.012000_1_plen_36_part_01